MGNYVFTFLLKYGRVKGSRIFLTAIPISRGGEGRAINFFSKNFFSDGKVPTAIKPEGGGGQDQNGTAIKKNFFLRLP